MKFLTLTTDINETQRTIMTDYTRVWWSMILQDQDWELHLPAAIGGHHESVTIRLNADAIDSLPDEDEPGEWFLGITADSVISDISLLYLVITGDAFPTYSLRDRMTLLRAYRDLGGKDQDVIEVIDQMITHVKTLRYAEVAEIYS